MQVKRFILDKKTVRVKMLEKEKKKTEETSWVSCLKMKINIKV